jgi:hypothetical protein
MSYLETSWAPVHKLNSSFVLNPSNGTVDVLRHNISPVQEAASHVLSVSGITLDHLVRWFEAGSSDVSNSKALMGCLVFTQNWGIGHQREMDPGVWHQVGLELGEINIKGTIESKRCSDRRHYLTDEPVQINVGWSVDI